MNAKHFLKGLEKTWLQAQLVDLVNDDAKLSDTQQEQIAGLIEIFTPTTIDGKAAMLESITIATFINSCH